MNIANLEKIIIREFFWGVTKEQFLHTVQKRASRSMGTIRSLLKWNNTKMIHKYFVSVIVHFGPPRKK